MRGTIKFCDLVRPILEILRYLLCPFPLLLLYGVIRDNKRGKINSFRHCYSSLLFEDNDGILVITISSIVLGDMAILSLKSFKISEDMSPHFHVSNSALLFFNSTLVLSFCIEAVSTLNQYCLCNHFCFIVFKFRVVTLLNNRCAKWNSVANKDCSII